MGDFMRNFNDWLSTFRNSISNYKYYTDFSKVISNVNSIKVELNILNSLVGSKDIENEFKKIINDYPNVLKCIPILLAIRKREIFAMDVDGEYNYNFKKMNYEIEDYCNFMKKTGLFDMISSHIINNLVDYVSGIEVGLDSNARKNRGGHIMEDLVEEYLKQTKCEYYKEMYLKDIENKWGLDLSELSNAGKSAKRFDFVVKTDKNVYGIETNFYSSGGSKLNETARSYKMLAEESQKVDGFKFVWFTDGFGWYSAKNNLEETFDVLDTIYNIKELENGIMKEIFI